MLAFIVYNAYRCYVMLCYVMPIWVVFSEFENYFGQMLVEHSWM